MKKKRIHQIDRRTFLRGLGSSVVALPMFDFFLNSNGTALAQTAGMPKRYFVVMNGLSPSRGGLNFLNPESAGANYVLRNAVSAFGNYGDLRNHVGVYSNLYLPFVPYQSSDRAPVGGYKGQFHNVASEVQLTGMRVDQGVIPLRGASSDQLMRSAFNANGNFVHLNLCAQPKSYLGSTTGSRSAMQYSSTGSRIQPQQSPQQAFNQLFFNFQDSDPEAEAQRRLATEKRKSVLDLLAKEQVDFLNRELGTRERALLSDHFDHIRTLERSLETIEEDLTTTTCRKPDDPGQDPPLGADYIGSHHDNRSNTNGYSNENLRANIMIDLIHMALTCDIARHGSLRLTFDQSYMNMFVLAGALTDYHEMSHYKGPESAFIQAIRWHVDKYARLVDKLRNTPEGAGNVLDNSVILFTSEGGGGRNSDSGSGNSAHSGYNMTTFVAGRVGGLRPGRHVVTNEVHPSRILFSAMRAAGYQGNSLGEVSGVVGDMF